MGLSRIRKPFESANFEYVLEVDFQIHSFSEYIKTTEKEIIHEVKRKIDAYEKFLKEAPDDEIQHEHDFEDHEIKMYTYQLYYNSIFISLYSFLEKKMYQFCKLAEKSHVIKIKDLSDEGVFKYQKYLKKVVGIKFDSLNAEWAEITKYNKLRNLLVHSPTPELETTENFHKQITTLKSINGLTIRDKGETIEFQITDKELLENFRKTISVFLHEIYYEKVV